MIKHNCHKGPAVLRAVGGPGSELPRSSGHGETPESPMHRWRVGVKAGVLCGQSAVSWGKHFVLPMLNNQSWELHLLLLLGPPRT